MKKRTRWLLLILVVCGLLMTAAPKAQAMDTVEVLAQISGLLGAPFPSHDDVVAAAPFLECVVSGKNVGDCILMLPPGNGALDTVVQLAKLYKDIEASDLWGVVGDIGNLIGDDAPCIVAAIMFPGVGGDLCALVKELIEAAAAIGEFVVAFFEDIGKAAKAVYCYFFGCDDGGPPPPPLEQVVYQASFASRVGDGVRAIEAPYAMAFSELTSAIKSQAISQFTAGSKPMYTADAWPGALQQYTTAVNTAAGLFYTVVDKLWSEDIVQNVLKALGAKRDQFQGPSEIAILALGVVYEYEKGPQAWNPSSAAIIAGNGCAEAFKTYGFQHVDRWVDRHKTEAQTLQLKGSNVWCYQDLWKNNTAQFAERFRTYLKNQGCAQTGQMLVCDLVARYRECSGLMATVGQQGQCNVNVAKAGVEAAQAMDRYFKASGSKVACVSGTLDFSKSGTGSQRVAYICSRPTQGFYCSDYYTQHYGDLPVKVLDCQVAEPPEYTKLKNRVQQVALLLQQGKDPHGGGAVQAAKPATGAVRTATSQAATVTAGGKPVAAATGGAAMAANSVQLMCVSNVQAPLSGTHDPLVVGAAECQVRRLKQGDQNLGFGPPSSKPGFEYREGGPSPFNIDGVSTPELWTIKEAINNPATKPELTTPDLRKQLGDLKGLGTGPNPTVISPVDQARQAALAGFGKSAAGWKGVAAPAAPTSACACGGLHAQIGGLDQKSAALIKEGEALAAILNSGKLDGAASAKATARLGDINKQLGANLGLRNSLAGQYDQQMKATQQQQKKAAK